MTFLRYQKNEGVLDKLNTLNKAMDSRLIIILLHVLTFQNIMLKILRHWVSLFLTKRMGNSQHQTKFFIFQSVSKC